ncbi:multidrug ABC transporter ATP-binding protein [Sporosarcina sp. P37]|uniref:ABC-F family ATP-binding cassette domain-containing protein n=1 Tax=unclassified Sporosarcina TaxID=2647733 RepID=UPI000A17EBCE|nr:MULTISPECIES: ABC-F family ATP-binding cassette domain-containing protein [unclassified Sporosarcina]ARK25418.1 multidrug ABC transporter ATP-binding protein [Sporosarcina sp. P37]PID19028.1 ABC transporter ATP-binding protein [Sporosarcina sp. P35]
MSHVTIEKLTKTVGEKTLFQNVEFGMQSGDKVGLIGINGTGKSTLLSILAGESEADSISMDHPNKFQIAYLPQEPVVNPELTVMEAVFESDAPIIRLNLNYEHALQNLSSDSANPEFQERFSHLQNEMDSTGGWDLNAQARTILMKLGIDMFDKKMGELSGGQQKRVALAKVLIEPADLLLLDEPTNHLDVASIQWLQDFLQNVQGAVLFITHDRYFLDQVATHIYELADKTLYSHTGNYADYLEAKALREEMNASSEQKNRNRYRNELKWIRRGAKARSTKQKARIGRFEELEEKVKQSDASLDFDMDLQTTRLGKKVLEIRDITKRFGDNVILHPFSAILQAKERIAIVGPNGVGKTTLLKMLDGTIEPDSGEVDKGSTVKIAHFHQHIPEMNENQRIIEYVRETSNDIETGSGERLSATQMLERFLFPSSAHGTPIGKLSGGERKRLYLLKLLMEQPNVLLLDEPTNDLDLETLSVLESFIDTFAGVVVTISHDRFFLDRISRKLWILDGSGEVDVRLGLYFDYLNETPVKEDKPSAKAEIPAVKEEKPKKKMTYAEKKQWETIESDIEMLEQKIAETEQQMLTAGSDYDQLRKLDEQLVTLNNEYEELIERWSYLQELAD